MGASIYCPQLIGLPTSRVLLRLAPPFSQSHFPTSYQRRWYRSNLYREWLTYLGHWKYLYYSW